MFFYKNKKAQATFEYMILIVFVLGAFLVFQKYIVRGISGQWKKSADQLGKGKQYDAHLTDECAFDFAYNDPGIWYNYVCFDNTCDAECFEYGNTKAACAACIQGCVPLSGICDGSELGQIPNVGS